MAERIRSEEVPQAVSQKLAKGYQVLVDLDPDFLVSVPNVGYMSRRLVQSHLSENDYTGQLIADHFLQNTDKFLKAEGYRREIGEDARVAATFMRWGKEAFTEILSKTSIAQVT